jgi:putative NAD(P)-binding protein
VASVPALETDYFVVGAGALGMAFVDSLIDHSDASVVIVDRRPGPGGHWLDAYPFVQLHQPSRFYGVNSTALGTDRIELGGTEPGLYGRASGVEICGYYDEIMRRRLVASDRVQFFPNSEYIGDQRFRSEMSGEVTQVTVRRRMVDATYMASHVPATDPPPFEVAEGVSWVPVGALPQLREPKGGYVVVGGGKTAMDGICWLLERGSDPDKITWIRPQDSWLLNRAFFQPAEPRTLEGVVRQLEAMDASTTVSDVYERLESHDIMVRIDRSVTPTMAKGATVSLRELDLLRQVEDVVHLGHVQRIEPERIILDRGEVPTTRERMHVHCAASGLADNPPRQIFTDQAITLQLVTRVGITLSGALQGFLETTARTTGEKNLLCRPTGMPHTPFDYLRAVSAGFSTELGWNDAPDLRAWLDRSRLNLLAGLEDHEEAGRVEQLQRRLLEVLFPALEKLPLFAAQATPRERARIYGPGLPSST